MSAQILILDTEPKRERAAKIVAQLPIEKPLKLTVEPFRARRSNTANRRLWALHQLAAEAVGCSAEDMHKDCLCDFYGYSEVRLPSGDMKRIPNERSSDKDTAKFAKFMEFCETRYITELGVFLG
jgi:hypothetical protein